ncbi:hypothetical protein [Brevundimonas sp.]|uniref:hypothetical protein n=1 Tax=Brevundimonas sp. TaxID=1871086 RepID=UPI003D6C8ACE
MRFFAVSLIALLASACDEVVHERHSDFQAARQAGAIERGWIPAFVPSSAYDIRDQHDLDSAAQTLSFRLPPDDVPAMLVGLKRAPDSEAETTRGVIAAAGWKSDRAQITVYQTCRNGDAAALAVNARTGAAFYQAPVKWRSDPCPLS